MHLVQITQSAILVYLLYIWYNTFKNKQRGVVMTRKETKIAKQQQLTSILSQMQKKDILKNMTFGVLINLLMTLVIVVIFALIINATSKESLVENDFYRVGSATMSVVFVLSLALFLFSNRNDRTGELGARYLYWIQVITQITLIFTFAIISIVLTIF